MTKSFLAALVLGAVLRTAALPLPGTQDVMVWKTWTYTAATGSVTSMYGIGGSPPERRLLEYSGRRTVVDYPPLALYEMAVVGRVYRPFDPDFSNRTGLTMAVKGAVVLIEAALAILIFMTVRRFGGGAVARWATTAYWLNPAALLDGAVLGYLDPLFMLPATAALVVAFLGQAAAAGILLAAAALTKAQALLIAPAVCLALWRSSDRPLTAYTTAAFAAGATTVALSAPFALAGALPNMAQALWSLTRHDMLSGFAVNLWWIVTWVLRAGYAIPKLGVWAALTMPVKILAVSTVVELGYPNPRLLGAALTAVAWGWAIWQARRVRELTLHTALAAFLVHAYFVLSVQVHENHLYPAVPLLAMAAVNRPRLRPVFLIVSAVVALDLNLFYGLGEGLGYAIPRSLTPIDFSVILATANVAALIWHARVLRGELKTKSAMPTFNLPAGTPSAARPRSA